MIFDVHFSAYCLYVLSVRREGALGYSGAELSTSEAVGPLRHSVHHQGRPSGLSGGTRPFQTLHPEVAAG